MDEPVEIYTDGACSGNPGPGGWGVLLRWNGNEREDTHGNCPFWRYPDGSDLRHRDDSCERWFGLGQLSAPAYGRKKVAQGELAL